MPHTFTITDVLAYGPCSPYDQLETLEHLFAGCETLTVRNVLDMTIPDLHKAVVVDKCALEPSERAAIKAKMLALVDQSSESAAEFQTTGEIWSYGSLVRAGVDRDAILSLVIAELEALV